MGKLPAAYGLRIVLIIFTFSLMPFQPYFFNNDPVCSHTHECVTSAQGNIAIFIFIVLICESSLLKCNYNMGQVEHVASNKEIT